MLTTTLSEIRKHRPCESGWTEAPTCLTKPTAARRVIAWGRLKDRPEVGARYGQILEGARVMKSQRVNTTKMWHILSLGAGVQSSTLALMAAAGEITPTMPDAAIFADTGAEPQSVYRWLDWLEQQLPFPVYRVMHKNGLTATMTDAIPRKDGNGYYCNSNIPAYTLGKRGEVGMINRQCTVKFKIEPIVRKIRKIAGIKRGQKDVTVTQWIGISLDELQRMKLARDPWMVNRFPLVEERMRRANCLEWMQSHGYPRPPRSACVYCPFHSNIEWMQLKEEEPEAFAEAVRVERMYQSAKAKAGFGGVPYLHKSCVPLDQVDFRSAEDRGQGVLSFDDECDGMCGV